MFSVIRPEIIQLTLSGEKIKFESSVKRKIPAFWVKIFVKIFVKKGGVSKFFWLNQMGGSTEMI